MKVNRNTLLWAIKKSTSMEDVTKLLGREPEYEERLLEKMLRFYPEAADYLTRNEGLQNMKEAKLNEDWDALKEARLEYIGATNRLITNKLIGKREIDILVYKLENKKRIITVPKEEIVDQPILDINIGATKEKEDYNTYKIDSPIVQQLMANINLK